MARILGRTSASSASKPLLATWTLREGKLIAPVALAYEIFDLSTPEKENDPLSVVARTDVDLTDDKVSTGHYAATWTVPSNYVALGRHEIRWYATLVTDGPELTWSTYFDVVGSPSGLPVGDVYAGVSDVRDEGVGSSVTDRRIIEKILEASQMLDTWTGRHFAPESKTLTLNGTRSTTLTLNEPVIAVEKVVLFDGFSDIEPPAYVVYNRHLQGLRNPDDRDTPKLEFRGGWWETRYNAGSYRYPNILSKPQWGGREPQSVKLTGVFGYTDPDGSPVGRTPQLATNIVVRMVLRELPKQNTMAAIMKRREAMITSMRTREQTIQWKEPSDLSGASYTNTTRFTGDPSIDIMIEQLCIPISGAVV